MDDYTIEVKENNLNDLINLFKQIRIKHSFGFVLSLDRDHILNLYKQINEGYEKLLDSNANDENKNKGLKFIRTWLLTKQFSLEELEFLEIWFKNEEFYALLFYQTIKNKRLIKILSLNDKKSLYKDRFAFIKEEITTNIELRSIIIAPWELDLKEFKTNLVNLKDILQTSVIDLHYPYRDQLIEINLKRLLSAGYSITTIIKDKDLKQSFLNSLLYLKKAFARGNESSIVEALIEVEHYFKSIEIPLVSTSEIEENIETDFPFPEEVVMKLGRRFETDFKELKIVYGRCSNCTAFLMRKIIEKALYYAFTTNGLENKITYEKGKVISLDALISKASNEYIEGTPILSGHTAQRLRGIKFLGDMAAHNCSINVDMKMIETEIKFYTIALKEISSKIKN